MYAPVVRPPERCSSAMIGVTDVMLLVLDDILDNARDVCAGLDSILVSDRKDEVSGSWSDEVKPGGLVEDVRLCCVSIGVLCGRGVFDGVSGRDVLDESSREVD